VVNTRRVYLDNAASTPMSRAVYRAMRPYLTRHYGNPSSIHKEGFRARMAIEGARDKIAKLLGCNVDEIFFTSGASEANSWVSAMCGCLYDDSSHDSIKLANDGQNGSLYSVPMANSETGRPSYYIDSSLPCHLDLTQSVGKKKFCLHTTECVSASLSAHKFGGPKGVGLLYIREDYQDHFKPLIYGHQEGGLRGGTENVAGIVGMAKALELAYKHWQRNKQKKLNCRNKIERFLEKKHIKYSSSENIINITFKNLNAQTAVRLFDKDGVAISAGSACNSGSDEPSKALLYYGYSEADALKTIRVSLGVQNTKRDIRRFLRILEKIIDKCDEV